MSKRHRTVPCLHDANGIRTSKDGKKYIVDVNNNVVAETDAEGTIISETLWGHKPLARKTGENWYYYIYNAHGDVIGMVDDEGNFVNSYTYDAWGNVLSETETVQNPIKYAGEYYDAELDMYYLRARYYQPQTGRFTSLDILEGDVTSPLDLNRYVYCRNNPVKYTDPSGEIVETIWDVISFVIGILDVVENPKDILSWVGLVGDIVDFIPFFTGVGESIKLCKYGAKSIDTTKDVVKITTKDATVIAKQLGFEKTKYLSHGQAVYQKGNKYITLDIDSHSGGFWKMADSVENLGKKSTRLGTYDVALNRIGD